MGVKWVDRSFRVSKEKMYKIEIMKTAIFLPKQRLMGVIALLNDNDDSITPFDSPFNITRTNVDLDLCRYKALLGHYELNPLPMVLKMV